MSHATYHLYLDWPETLVRDLTIDAGASLSNAIDLWTYKDLAIEMSAAWTAAVITFLSSDTLTGTYLSVYGNTGTEISVTVAAATIVSLDIEALKPLRFIKIRSGTAASPVVQGAIRNLRMMLSNGGSEYLTPYLTPDSLKWNYGRDYPSQLIGKSIAGKLDAQLWNDDGRFSSFKTDSPLYGMIFPGLGIRLVMEFESELYTMWRGVLDNLIPNTIHSRPGAALHALGVLYAVNQTNLHIQIQKDVTTGLAVTEILDEIRWPGSRREIDTGETTLTRWWTGGIKALTGLRDLESTEGGFIRETKDGSIAFEDRMHRLSGDHGSSQAEYTYDPTGQIRYDPINQGDPLKELFNVIVAKVKTFEVDSASALWTLAESGDSSPSIPPGELRTFWTTFPGSAPTNAVAVEDWTTPLVATTDYTANSLANGTGTNMTGDLTVFATPFDTTLKIDITNNGAVPAFITLLQARGTALLQHDPVEVHAEDAPSIELYNERRYVLEGTGIPTTAEAEIRLNDELQKRKIPIPILTLSIQNISDDQMLEILTRDVSDRITIDARGIIQLGIFAEFYVEEIAHAVNGPIHTMTLKCSWAAPAHHLRGAVQGIKGVQPAASGGLTYERLRTLTGTQPSASGTLTYVGP